MISINRCAHHLSKSIANSSTQCDEIKQDELKDERNLDVSKVIDIKTSDAEVQYSLVDIGKSDRKIDEILRDRLFLRQEICEQRSRASSAKSTKRESFIDSLQYKVYTII